MKKLMLAFVVFAFLLLFCCICIGVSIFLINGNKNTVASNGEVPQLLVSGNINTYELSSDLSKIYYIVNLGHNYDKYYVRSYDLISSKDSNLFTAVSSRPNNSLLGAKIRFLEEDKLFIIFDSGFETEGIAYLYDLNNMSEQIFTVPKKGDQPTVTELRGNLTAIMRSVYTGPITTPAGNDLYIEYLIDENNKYVYNRFSTDAVRSITNLSELNTVYSMINLDDDLIYSQTEAKFSGEYYITITDNTTSFSFEKMNANCMFTCSYEYEFKLKGVTYLEKRQVNRPISGRFLDYRGNVVFHAENGIYQINLSPSK